MVSVRRYEYMRKWKNEHRSLLNEYQRKWYRKNRESALKSSKKWYQKNKKRMALWKKKYRAENIVRLLRREKERYDKNKTVFLENRKKLFRERRELIVKSYGGKCVCCGESNFEFLALDHVNGGGRQDRIKNGPVNQEYYQIIKKNYPKKYRLLCHNCNQSLGYYKYCPHNKEFK